MVEFLKEIAGHTHGTLDIQERTWYNGHAMMPFHIYKLEFQDKDLKVQFIYEHRQSEFAASTRIDGGAFGDRHIFQFFAENPNTKHPNFEVVESNFFNRIFVTGHSHFRIKTTSSEFKRHLSNNLHLKEIMKFITIDPDFSPSIHGKFYDGVYSVKIRFQTRSVHYNLLDYHFKFLEFFS